MDYPYYQYFGYDSNLLWKYLFAPGEMCQLIMGYYKENIINCDPNYYAIHHNDKPTVGTIDECPYDYPIKDCSQTTDGILGG